MADNGEEGEAAQTNRIGKTQIGWFIIAMLLFIPLAEVIDSQFWSFGASTTVNTDSSPSQHLTSSSPSLHLPSSDGPPSLVPSKARISASPTPPRNGRPPLPRAENTVIFFVHIQKSGGSTLRNFIWKNEPKAELEWFGWVNYPIMNPRRKANLNWKWRDIPVIMGHFLYGLHAISDPRPHMYFSIIRNPFDRVVSHYYWLQTIRATFFDTIDGWLRSRKWMLYDNHLTRIICGPKAFFTRGIGAEQLECAKENLKTFAVVMINEQYALSLKLLERSLGWKHFDVPRQKVVMSVENAEKNPVEFRLNATNVANINNHVSWDKELYKFAVTLFIQQLKNYDLYHELSPGFEASVLS